MMYVVFIICYIHHLLNEPRKWIFAYISDRRVYNIKSSYIIPMSIDFFKIKRC
jgi:hypothetical protein